MFFIGITNKSDGKEVSCFHFESDRKQGVKMKTLYQRFRITIKKPKQGTWLSSRKTNFGYGQTRWFKQAIMSAHVNIIGRFGGDWAKCHSELTWRPRSHVFSHVSTRWQHLIERVIKKMVGWVLRGRESRRQTSAMKRWEGLDKKRKYKEETNEFAAGLDGLRVPPPPWKLVSPNWINGAKINLWKFNSRDKKRRGFKIFAANPREKRGNREKETQFLVDVRVSKLDCWQPAGGSAWEKTVVVENKCWSLVVWMLKKLNNVESGDRRWPRSVLHKKSRIKDIKNKR